MKNILPHLDNNIQEIYRKALDADAQLNELKKQGMGKFSAIFEQNSLFNCNEKSFLPYVAELTEDIAKFRESEDQQQLTTILKKMELLYQVLGSMKNITKGN